MGDEGNAAFENELVRSSLCKTFMKGILSIKSLTVCAAVLRYNIF